MARSRYKSEAKYKASLKHSAKCNKMRRQAIKEGKVKKGDGKHMSHATGGGGVVSSGKDNVRRPRKGKDSKEDPKGKKVYSDKLNKKQGRPPKKDSKPKNKSVKSAVKRTQKSKFSGERNASRKYKSRTKKK